MKELVITSKSEQALYETEQYNVNVNIQSSTGGMVESVSETFLDKENGYVASVNARVDNDKLRYNFDVQKEGEMEVIIAVARDIERIVFKTDTTTISETEE